MGALDGRVAIITGAGRGLGREHALLFASEGAKVVVNDLGGDMHGEGGDPSAAMQVVEEIKAMGGEAVVNGDNVADWDGAQRLVQQAIDTFGDLHVLVNNAGILRDRVIINMTEAEWDAVITRAPEGPLRADAPRRRLLARADEGRQGGEGVDHPHDVDVGPVRQPGPGELRRGQERASRRSRRCARRSSSRYGVRSNAIAPGARTRLTEATPGLGDAVKAPEDGLRRVGPRQRVAVRRVPRHRRLPDHRRVLHGAGRQGAARAVVEGRGDDRQGRPLDGRGARGRGREARAAAEVRRRGRVSYVPSRVAL